MFIYIKKLIWYIIEKNKNLQKFYVNLFLIKIKSDFIPFKEYSSLLINIFNYNINLMKLLNVNFLFFKL